MKTSLIYLSLLTLAGCAKAKPTVSPVHVVKGDPYVFVKAANMNGNQAFPEDLFADNSGWQVLQNGFEEGLADHSTMAQATASESPGQKAIGLEHSSSIRVIRSENEVRLQKADAPGSQLVFKRVANTWRFDYAIADGKNIPLSANFQVLHTSVTPDRQAFSLLFGSQSPRSVVSWTFVRDQEPVSHLTNKFFEYIFGSGVKVGWDSAKPVVMNLCDSPSDAMTSTSVAGINQWKTTLEDRLNFRVQSAANCPPFSDLNSHNLYFVRDWIEFAGDLGKLGMTMSYQTGDHQFILDSDVFILLSEFQESMDINRAHLKIVAPEAMDNPHLAEVLQETVVHETGHFLGLQHKFDGTASIMSYAEQNASLKDYDKAAITELYSPN